MKTKVMSVFAGLGKTTVGNKYANICDLTSSKFRFDYSNIDDDDYEKMKYDNTRIVNKDWPSNYIKVLREAIKEYDLVLVPSNEDIRDLLKENAIEFSFVLPSMDSKDMLINRYKMRGNSDVMINEVLSYFDNWSRDQSDYDYPIYILDKEHTLEDLLIDLEYINKT